MKSEITNGTVPADQVYASMTCSHCGTILDFTKEIFDDFIRMHSEQFETMLINRIAEHFSDLEKLKQQKGVQCELIGSTADWRKHWPFKTGPEHVP